MLPDLRFVIGAVLATAFLAVNFLGLFAAVPLAHQAKVGPIEAWRPMAFADRADWKQFADPDGVRRLDEPARQPVRMDAAAQRAPAEPTVATRPAAPASPADPPDYDYQPGKE